MKNKVFSLFISMLILLFSAVRSSAIAAGPVDSLKVPSFGLVYIYNRTTTPENIIIMISGDAGWRSGAIGVSQAFSEMNTLVIGVDILRYFKDLRLRKDKCYIMSADIVELATEVEKKYDFPDYKPPLIMGYASGATLVYAILAQARKGTFIGGISVDFCPDIKLPGQLCEINGLKVTADIQGKRYSLQPDAVLENPWIVLKGKSDKTCSYSDITDFISRTKNAELVALTDAGHGFSKWSDYLPQWKEAFERLVAKYENEMPKDTDISEVKNMPLIITNSKITNRKAPVALLISGDGGWYGFEQQIADNLAERGIPTIGLDSKKFFWKRRTPEETSEEVAKALNYYSTKWGRGKIVLVGYSLGAEIVPFIVNRLPSEIKSKIESVVLLSPAETTDFEIHLSNMLGLGNRQNTYNALDEINKMQGVNTLIIFGEGEKTQIPELLKNASVVVRKIPGDHHYKFNLPLIMQTMRENKAF